MRLLFEHFPGGIVVLGIDKGILFSNAMASLLLGITEEQVQGKTAWDTSCCFLREDGTPTPPEEHPVSRVLSSGLPVAGHVTGICRPGSAGPVWVICNAWPARNPAGHIVCVVVAFTDISERKKADEELRESEARYRTIFDRSPLGIAIIDSHTGSICEMNQSCARIAGRTWEELERIDWMSFTHPDDVAQNLDLVAKMSSGEIPEFQMNKRYLRPDGSTVWVSLTDTPLPGPTLPHKRHLCTIEDITERRQAEEKIKKLLAEKELLLKEVHHRIKNNMAAMMSLLSLQSAGMENPEAAAALRDAGNRLKSMEVLYDKLYCSESFTEMSIRDYLPPLVNEITGQFPNRGRLTIETDVGDFLLSAKTLPPLGILVNELITNAMKYAFTGRDSGVLKVSASMRDNRALVVIEDDGIGIPESLDIENSAGFGLQLVNMLAHQLKGTIQIERRRGSRFILEFEA